MNVKLTLLLNFWGYFTASLGSRCGYYAHCVCPDIFTLYCSGSLPLNVNELKQSAPLEHVLLFDGRGRDIGLYFIPNLATYAPKLKKVRLEYCNCAFIVPYLNLDLPFVVTHSCTLSTWPLSNVTVTEPVITSPHTTIMPYVTTESPTLSPETTTQDTVITTVTSATLLPSHSTPRTTEAPATTKSMTTIILSSITPTSAVIVSSTTPSSHYLSSTPTHGGYHPTSHASVSVTFNIYFYIFVPISIALTGVISGTISVLCCYKRRHGHYPRCRSRDSAEDEENQLGGDNIVRAGVKVKKEPCVMYKAGASCTDDGSVTFGVSGEASAECTGPDSQRLGNSVYNDGAHFGTGEDQPTSRSESNKEKTGTGQAATCQSGKRHIKDTGKVTSEARVDMQNCMNDGELVSEDSHNASKDTSENRPCTPSATLAELNIKSSGPKSVKWPYFSFFSKIKKKNVESKEPSQGGDTCTPKSPSKEPPSGEGVCTPKSSFSGPSPGGGTCTPKSTSEGSAPGGVTCTPESPPIEHDPRDKRPLVEVKKEPLEPADIREEPASSPSPSQASFSPYTCMSPVASARVKSAVSPHESIAMGLISGESDTQDPQTLIKNFIASPLPAAKNLSPSSPQSVNGSGAHATDMNMSQEEQETSLTEVKYEPEELSFQEEQETSLAEAKYEPGELPSMNSSAADLINFSNSFQSVTIKEEPPTPTKENSESDSEFPWSEFHTPMCSTPSRPPPPSMAGSPELVKTEPRLDDSTSSAHPLLTPVKSVKLSSIKRRVGYTEVQSNWDLRNSTPIKKICTLPQCEDSDDSD